jgi:hypothetical protein
MSSRCKSCPARVVPAGSNWSGDGGDEVAGVFGVEGRFGDLATWQAETRVNAEQASK